MERPHVSKAPVFGSRAYYAQRGNTYRQRKRQKSQSLTAKCRCNLFQMCRACSEYMR